MPKNKKFNLKFVIYAAIFLYLGLNLLAILSNLSTSKTKEDITNNETILIVSAHQDDETIIAGGAMIKTLNKGGNIYVIYTLDGVTKEQHLTKTDVKNLTHGRKQEAYEALGSIGIPNENIYFLRHENQLGLRKISNIITAIEQVSEKIATINPQKIFIAAYEGGHCDHDITNYIAAKAAEKAGFPANQIFEAPEYNNYYLSESILKRINKYIIFKFHTPPRFLPSETKQALLPMSKDELETKKSMLRYFKSQNVEDELVERFGYPDRYRTLVDYNYSAGPFNPEKVLRYNLCLLYKRNAAKCSPFWLCEMKSEDYKNLYMALEEIKWQKKNQTSLQNLNYIIKTI